MAERVTLVTVETYVQPINGHYHLTNLSALGSADVVRLAMKWMKRKAAERGIRQSKPRRGAAGLDAAVSKLGDSLVDLRDAALASLAYVALARVSELVVLDMRNVRPKGGVAVAYIARPKADQEGDGYLRFVALDTFARVGA
jgi:hypothetical protein